MKNTDLRVFVISANGLLLTALVCWLGYFFPWFGYLEQSSFFCFLPSYLEPFLTKPAGVAELAARFLAQFFLFPVGVVAVHFALVMQLSLSLVGITRALKCRSLWWGVVAGSAFLPYWIFAFNGMAGFTVAVAYVANLTVAWACLSLARFKGWGMVCVFITAVFMYHFTGPLALFCLLPVMVRFPVYGWALLPFWLLMAFLDARCFIYSFIQTSGIAFWQSCDFVQKTVWIVTTVIWLAGIFFCRIQWNPVRHDSHRGFILLPVWAILWLIPVWCEARPLERAFYLSEQYARQENWKKVIKTTSDYFDRHPFPDASADYNEAGLRDMMAVNLKLALLKTGRLNDSFFAYGNIEEMNTYMIGLSAGGHYNFPSVRFAFQSGLWIPLRIFTNNILNAYGIENATLRAIIPNSIFWQRYELARNYLYYQSHTLFYRKEARYWQAFADESTSDQQAAISFRRQSDSRKMWEEEGLALDAWVQAMYSPASDSTTLEYFTFTQLFYKKPDSLPALTAHYRRLGYRTLPQYLQEALLIIQHYEPSGSTPPQTYSEYTYSPAVLKNYVRAESDRILYREGVLTLDELQSRYGSTYWFHYYFRRFY